MPHGCVLRESGSVDPQVLVPPFNLTGNELGPVTAIDWRCARALGGNMRAAGQQWGRSSVWSPCTPPLSMTDIWRMLPHDLVAGLNFLAVSMTGTGARSSLGAMETAVGGRKHRQKRSAELLQI